MFILPVVLTLVFVKSCICQCDERTRIYNDHGRSNDNYWYFDPRTFTKSTLHAVTKITPQQYKTLINKDVPCVGQWCVDSAWKCNVGDSQSCYNVEHIIPKGNTIKEIGGCSTDILGNFIMSYGAWNQALSNKYYGEKVEIYGSEIVKSAYISIYKSCFNITPLVIPNELCSSNFISPIAYIFSLIGGSIIVFAIGCIIVRCIVPTYFYKDDNKNIDGIDI